MKMLPILLINIALVGGGLIIYDQLRSDAPNATYQTGGVDGVQISNLEDRIARLEQRGETPMLRSSGGEGLAQRVEALEQRFANVPPPPAGPRPEAGDGTRPPMPRPDAASGDDPQSQPSDEELQWFRRMREADEQARREERERDQLTRMLKGLDITLDKQQTDKLLTAQRDMRKKMGEVWRNVRRGPDVDREQVRQEMGQKMEQIRDEFSVTINKFIPAADATKIVESSNRFGRGFMGAGGSRRGR